MTTLSPHRIWDTTTGVLLHTLAVNKAIAVSFGRDVAVDTRLALSEDSADVGAIGLALEPLVL